MRDGVLHRKNIVHHNVVCLRPQVSIGFHIDQLRRDAEIITGLAHTPFKYMLDVELCRYGFDIGIGTLK